MDLIDFEELIDLGGIISLINTDKQNENGSQKSSEEPLADVLDKMCAAMVENDLVMAGPLKGDIDEGEIDTVVDFEESEEMCEATVGSNLALDDHIKHDTDGVERYTIVDLDEFEHILAATYISNNCTNIDETDNIVDKENANTALKEIIEPVVPYDLPIDSEEIAETFAECAPLDEDKKLACCSLNSVVDLDTLVGAVNMVDNEIENKYNLETAKLKNIDISFIEDIVNKDEVINDCCYKAEENDADFGNTTNRKRMNTSMDCDNDIIIISSDSDDGYNSSDFEFISEDEAYKEGIVYNTKITLKKSMGGNIACLHAAPCDTNEPSTSNPHINEASPSEYIKYSKYRYQRCYAEPSSDYHVIPEGEQYLDMFRGQFAPAIANSLHMMTNKSVLLPTPMGAMFDDLGFKFEDHDVGEEHGQYKEELEECAKKIRSTYPNENRKRRRRC